MSELPISFYIARCHKRNASITIRKMWQILSALLLFSFTLISKRKRVSENKGFTKGRLISSRINTHRVVSRKRYILNNIKVIGNIWELIFLLFILRHHCSCIKDNETRTDQIINFLNKDKFKLIAVLVKHCTNLKWARCYRKAYLYINPEVSNWRILVFPFHYPPIMIINRAEQ